METHLISAESLQNGSAAFFALLALVVYVFFGALKLLDVIPSGSSSSSGSSGGSRGDTGRDPGYYKPDYQDAGHLAATFKGTQHRDAPEIGAAAFHAAAQAAAESENDLSSHRGSKSYAAAEEKMGKAEGEVERLKGLHKEISKYNDLTT